MIDLGEIRQRAEAATEGVWAVYGPYGTTVRYIQIRSQDNTVIAELEGEKREDNSDFIAHAREDIPALLAEVERLRGENEALHLGIGWAYDAFQEMNLTSQKLVEETGNPEWRMLIEQLNDLWESNKKENESQ